MLHTIRDYESAIRDEMINLCKAHARDNPQFSRAMANVIKELNLNEPLEFATGNVLTTADIVENNFTASFWTIACHYEIMVLVHGRQILNYISGQDIVQTWDDSRVIVMGYLD